MYKILWYHVIMAYILDRRRRDSLEAGLESRPESQNKIQRAHSSSNIFKGSWSAALELPSSLVEVAGTVADPPEGRLL